MEFFNSLFLPPSPDHLQLIKIIVLLIYFIHIPFISLMIGGTFFSWFYRILYRREGTAFYGRVARDFTNTLVFGKTAGILLGIVPLVILVLVEGQIFYDSSLNIVSFLLYTTVFAAIGITGAYFYQAGYRKPGVSFLAQFFIGGLALVFLLMAYLVFVATTGLILDPGRWFIITSVADLLFSWNVIARFLHFITAAFAVSGAAFVFFTRNWKDTRQDVEPEYAQFILKVGGGITMTFVVLQPLLIFWNLITMPGMALSAVVYALSVFVIFLIFLLSLNVYKLLKDCRPEMGTSIFVFFIVVLLVMIVNDHVARENSIENHTKVLVQRAEEAQAELKARREEKMTAAQEPDLKLGEQIFNNRCSSCHRFDQRVVGPPYNEVLPKYAGNKEKLVEFVKNPKKINPDYPQMPDLGLTDHQVRSVVAFLLQHLREEKKQ